MSTQYKENNVLCCSLNVLSTVMGCLYKVFGNGINVPIYVQKGLFSNHNAGIGRL